MKTLDTLNPKGKIILVRTDYNVPIKDGAVDGDLRLRASFPTIEYLKKKGAKKIILISHLGRPEGTRKPELSLKPVAKRLAELLEGTPVNFVDDVSGPDVEEAVSKLQKGRRREPETRRHSPPRKSPLLPGRREELRIFRRRNRRFDSPRRFRPGRFRRYPPRSRLDRRHHSSRPVLRWPSRRVRSRKTLRREK